MTNEQAARLDELLDLIDADLGQVLDGTADDWLAALMRIQRHIGAAREILGTDL